MRGALKLAYGIIVVLVTRWRMAMWSPAAIARYQQWRGGRMLAYARRRCRYWAERAEGLSNRQWRQLPVSEKRDLMARFSDSHPAGIPRDEAERVALTSEKTRDFKSQVRGLTVGLSSGTSGHRSLFLVSPSEQIGWAALMYSRLIGRVSFKPRRIAFFLRSNSNLYEEMATRFVSFEYFDLALSDDEIDRRLHALKPDILVGPPAVLGRLAARKAAGVLDIAPELVVSGAEVLEPQEKARLEDVFGAVVREVYQCTEGTIAASCAHGRMHLMEDIVAVDEEPAGEGRINPVVTMLHRRAQPFLRYRMNDLLVMQNGDAPCPCGSAFRVVERIEGRKDDVLLLPALDGCDEDHDAERPIYPDTVRQAVLQVDGVDEYRVVQTGPGDLHVHVLPSASAAEDLERAVANELQQALLRCGARAQTITCDRSLPHEDRFTKLRRVRRLTALTPSDDDANVSPERTVP